MASKKTQKTPEERKRSREKSNANLMPIQEINSRLTPEERKAKAHRAGKASVEKRRQSRAMMDMARKILEMPVGEAYKQNRSIMERIGIPESDMNYANAMLAVIAVKAMSGDVNAAKYVRDSAGYDPMSVLKEEQFEYMKENGSSINVTLDGEVNTKSRVQIYLPERDADPE